MKPFQINLLQSKARNDIKLDNKIKETIIASHLILKVIFWCLNRLALFCKLPSVDFLLLIFDDFFWQFKLKIWVEQTNKHSKKRIGRDDEIWNAFLLYLSFSFLFFSVLSSRKFQVSHTQLTFLVYVSFLFVSPSVCILSVLLSVSERMLYCLSLCTFLS